MSGLGENLEEKVAQLEDENRQLRAHVANIVEKFSETKQQVAEKPRESEA